MFGKNPRLNPLESRKQLLVAESELNRAQLVQEWQAMTDGVRSVAARASTISFIAFTGVSLIASLASFWRSKSVDAGARPSWLKTILNSAGQISTLWLAFRSWRRDQKDK